MDNLNNTVAMLSTTMIIAALLLLLAVGVFWVALRVRNWHVRDRRVLSLEQTVGEQYADIQRQLEQSLAQLQLVTEISNSFITGGDTDELIYSAMEMSSMVVDCDDISLALCHEDGTHFEERVHWSREDGRRAAPCYTLGGGRGKMGRYASAFVDNHLSYIIFTDDDCGIGTALAVPLFVSEALVGILQFGRFQKLVNWDEPTVYLANTLGSILSGVIYRERLAHDLIRMSSIVTNSPDLISFLHPERGIEYLNPAYEKVTGYAIADLMKSDARILYDEAAQQRLYVDLAPAALANQQTVEDVLVHCKSGEVLTMRFTLFPVFNKRGDAIEGVGCIAVDVTRKRKMERELIESKENAERANRAKTHFLANMSHEIRTPMNAIIGMTHIAQGSDSMPVIKDSLDKIASSSAFLLEIINNILDMSKIEAERLELSPTNLSLRELLRNVHTIVSVRAEEKRQRVRIDVPDSVPDRYHSDPLRLTQILTNLLYNAVKFSDNGSEVTLRIAVTEQTEAEARLRFDVIDQGIGISDEQLERLFTPFEQADASMSRRYGGTGLGLALTKNIVHLMGGELSVESELGQGATFTVELALRLSEDEACAAQRAADEADLVGKRLLVVDDVEINREIVMMMLEPTGLQLDAAENGLAAVDKVKGQPDGYDLVLMDVQMPEMDGYQATRAIHEINPRLPVVAMTANAFREDVEQAMEAGMVDHVAKPLQMEKLMGAIGRHIL